MAPAREVPEIAEALAEFVAGPAPYFIGPGPRLDLRAIASGMRLLPVVLDAGGCLGLRPSGAVASLLWDDPGTLRPEPDARIRNLAYFQAGLKYPKLARLAPSRPREAVECPHCGGSGRCSGLPSELASRVVCYCGGLGWLPGQGA